MSHPCPPRLLALLALALAPGACKRNESTAQSAPAVQRGGQGLSACQGHSVNEACTLTWGTNSINGTCVESPRGLLCRPPPRPEAIAACRDRAEGAACTVTIRERELQGTCATRPGFPLACQRPMRGEGHGEGHGEGAEQPAAQ